MNWFKLLEHDLRRGLFRWRMLLVPLLFLLPCAGLRSLLSTVQSGGTWMDYMLYCFLGEAPKDANGELTLSLPIFWMLAVGGCLFFNLDYMLRDLTNAGQQILIRSGTRQGWFLSKCVWNMASCVEYILLAGVSVLLFTLFFGGRGALTNTPDLVPAMFYGVLFEPTVFSVSDLLLATVLMPLVSLMALSMLQMALCLWVRPIVSFLISMALLVAAVFISSPLIPGSGAMTIRSGALVEGGISPLTAAVAALLIIILSAVAGCVRFQHTDILKLEES